MRYAAAISFISLLVFATGSAVARIPPIPDANDAAFSATEIVIVSAKDAHTFTIEKSYRGKRAVGETVALLC